MAGPASLVRRKDAAVIIVAAGQGLRFGGSVRKQYVKLLGRPLLWWSLKAFQDSARFASAVLVVPAADKERLRKETSSWRIPFLHSVVSGGATRSDSVAEGLRAVPAGLRWIAVHDAVRSLITPAIIQGTLEAAQRFGAAIAAVPSRDTVKLSDDKGFIKATPPRKTVWLAQTPQIFRRSVLQKALERRGRYPATDDAELAERAGCRVKLVDASPENIKVTFPSDVFLAKKILQARIKGR